MASEHYIQLRSSPRYRPESHGTRTFPFDMIRDPNLLFILHLHNPARKRMSTGNRPQCRFSTIMSIIRIFLFNDRIDITERSLARSLGSVIVLSRQPVLRSVRLTDGTCLISSFFNFDFIGPSYTGCAGSRVGPSAPNVLLHGISFKMDT